jgi:uncharacterized protein YkwD
MNAFGKRVRRLAILAAGSALVAGCASAPIRSSPAAYADPPDKSAVKAKAKPKASPPQDLEDLRDQILEAHNQIRLAARLHSLSVSKRLQAAAQAHALDMAAHHKMSHKGSKGSTPADRVEAKGYSFRRVGENVAYGRYSVERLMKGWMDSPPHKRNILGGFSQIGVGCAIDEDGRRYWCVNFGLPAGQ